MDKADRSICAALIGACFVGGAGVAVHVARVDPQALIIIGPLFVLALTALVSLAKRP